MNDDEGYNPGRASRQPLFIESWSNWFSRWIAIKIQCKFREDQFVKCQRQRPVFYQRLQILLPTSTMTSWWMVLSDKNLWSTMMNHDVQWWSLMTKIDMIYAERMNSYIFFVIDSDPSYTMSSGSVARRTRLHQNQPRARIVAIQDRQMKFVSLFDPGNPSYITASAGASTLSTSIRPRKSEATIVYWVPNSNYRHPIPPVVEEDFNNRRPVFVGH